jgi:nitrogen fixation NifU-like protein
MSNSFDLYQEAILDHGRRPRNRRAIDNCSHQARNENPSCGDEVVVFLDIDHRGVIRDAAFDGHSCAIATASASLMTEVLVGKTPAQAKCLFDCFHSQATGAVEAPLDGMKAEGQRLALLAGVHEYPVRVKCATLAWQTMLAALEDQRSQQ